MSFSEYKENISDGDTVILYLGHNTMQAITITPGKIHQTKYGALPHADMIGRRFGTKMFSKNRKGWVYLLHPTPELWTVNLRHRTQILYTTDISIVILKLALKPGSIVVESGTGSGSMSHSLIRTIAPTGHLHTFEFHAERAEIARKEFEHHKIADLVTVTCRDVCKEGFGLSQVADAVFLDLPGPWDAIQSSKEALKSEGGRFCSFSPCIEQVQKTCEALRSHGFRDITVMECLSRSFEVKTIPFQVPYLGPTSTTKLPEQPPSSRKRKLESEGDCSTVNASTPQGNEAISDDAAHTLLSLSENVQTDEKLVHEQVDCKAAMETSLPRPLTEVTDTDPATGLVRNVRAVMSQKANKTNILTGRPLKDMTGHTGYLTFATLYAQRKSSEAKCDEEEAE